MHDEFKTLRKFDAGQGRDGFLFSLPALEEQGIGKISRLPVSIRIVLESVLRSCDGKKVRRKDVETLAKWNAKAPANAEIPFVVARIVLQDFTGVPLIVDLAAMRSAVARLGRDPNIIEPLVPVDLVVDHSVQVDFFGSPRALELNLDMEFKRNRERYQFLKWGQQAFKTFQLIPPAIGIVHQVNLEYLAKGVLSQKSEGRGHEAEIFYPDTLVGTDSHTTMINGLGVVGWGVGGIEAEAGMLGQPVYFLTPDVVGVHLKGKLHPALTATDRATLANMAPEYGATMGFFPVDQKTVEYFRGTGRTDEAVNRFAEYFKAQGLFGIPRQGQIDYSQELELDLSSIKPSLAGPKRPQDRIDLDKVSATFGKLFTT